MQDASAVAVKPSEQQVRLTSDEIEAVRKLIALQGYDEETAARRLANAAKPMPVEKRSKLVAYAMNIGLI